jgi:quercetin dioxygenase-like cupin family protein
MGSNLKGPKLISGLLLSSDRFFGKLLASLRYSQRSSGQSFGGSHKTELRKGRRGASDAQENPMQVLPAVAALALLMPLGQALATDYNPPFPPVVTPGDQTKLIYPSTPVELLVTENESGGQFGMVVDYTKPGEGPPGDNALLENKLTETFYVLQGKYRFTVGEEVVTGGPGTIVVNPPKVPHGFRNVGDGIGRLLIVYVGDKDGSMKGTDFFVQWTEQSTRSAEWIAKTNEAYGIDR